MPGKSLQTARSTQYDWFWDVLIFHGSLSNGLFVTRSCLMFFWISWISIHGIVVYRPPYCPRYIYPSARWNWMATSPIYGSPVPTYIDLFDLPVNSSWIFQKPILVFSSQRVGRGIFRLRARCLSSTDWSLRTCQCSTANSIKITNRLVLLVRISFWQALVKSLRSVWYPHSNCSWWEILVAINFNVRYFNIHF